MGLLVSDPDLLNYNPSFQHLQYFLAQDLVLFPSLIWLVNFADASFREYHSMEPLVWRLLLNHLYLHQFGATIWGAYFVWDMDPWPWLQRRLIVFDLLLFLLPGSSSSRFWFCWSRFWRFICLGWFWNVMSLSILSCLPGIALQTWTLCQRSQSEWHSIDSVHNVLWNMSSRRAVLKG